jgi:hypothetical protein
MNVLRSNEIFIVSVDSRGTSSTDMTAYNEQTCSYEFFEQHIHDNPKNICVKSQVAGLCGLNLKLYFHDHSPFHHAKHEDYKVYKPMCTNVNGIATLLTFNPETGYYNHLVFGKAYVLLNDGTTSLSKEQVWGLQELITEAKTLYHRNGVHISEEAHQELLTRAAQYQAGTWVPHSIYEPRHDHRPVYYRFASGMSDQATCHHGGTHVHHDGHHNCCHNDGEDIWEAVAWDQQKIDCGEVHDPDHHHIVTKSTGQTDHSTPAEHDRSGNKIQIFATGRR